MVNGIEIRQILLKISLSLIIFKYKYGKNNEFICTECNFKCHISDKIVPLMLCKVLHMIQHTGEKSLFYTSMHTGEEPNYRKVFNIAVHVILKGIYSILMVTFIFM